MNKPKIEIKIANGKDLSELYDILTKCTLTKCTPSYRVYPYKVYLFYQVYLLQSVPLTKCIPFKVYPFDSKLASKISEKDF